MNKNGFTLIELLAVIVILAIIALIATPIILGIINDAREESQERSVELYASAVKNGIAAYQLRTGNELKAGIYNQTDDTKKLPFKVEKDGEVVCEKIEIYEDGGVYVSDCTVNDVAVDYSYGTKKQIYKPQYYTWNLGGFVGTTVAPTNPSDVPPTDKNYYLGYDISDGKVSVVYACFIKNQTEYCLKGTDTEAYETNKAVIEDAFGNVENACVDYSSYFVCGDNVFQAIAYSNGNVYAFADPVNCRVTNYDYDGDIFEYSCDGY